MGTYYTTRREALEDCAQDEEPKYNDWEGAWEVVRKELPHRRQQIRRPIKRNYEKRRKSERYVDISEINENRKERRNTNSDDKPLMKFLKMKFEMQLWMLILLAFLCGFIGRAI